MKTKLALLPLLLALATFASAQSISVASFRLLDTDMTANLQGTLRTDQNGHTAALIKVVTTQTGFTFEGGMMGIVDTQQKSGEVWVYIPYSSKKITITHPQLGVLRDYYFPITIEEAKTYEMQLTTAKVTTIVEEQVRQQYLMFQITPHDAVLEVNDQVWNVSAEGSARKFVNFGTYDYRVQAANYHPEVGKATVNDPNYKTLVTINLRPNFGWIEVPGTSILQGASIYIDNTFVGKAPFKSEALKSGQHSIKIAKELYDTYNATITVNDNQTTNVSPTLTADFANITLKVDDDAEIWVNDEKKGTRTWTGNLASGTYKIECKKPSHETTVTTKEVNNQMDGQTITLSPPIPIYGSLNIESTPDYATIYLDDKKMGETPLFLSQVLIGQRQIKLTKSGYADYEQSITITNGQQTTVNAALLNVVQVQITSNVASAVLFIDGRPYDQFGNSKQRTVELSNGSHHITATADGYNDFTGTIDVSDNHNTFSVELHSKAPKPLTFTANGVTFKMLSVAGGTFTMGATSEQGSDAYDDEKPTHSVTLSDFYLGETEVTQALWQAVMGDNPSKWSGNDLPVEKVSWNDCQEFVTKLNTMLSSQLGGKHFALPTEAEWEYAARGGQKSNGYKYSGSNTLGDVAWYSGSQTHPVAQKQPNELGLYDMSGNVWEWCADWYDNYSNSAQNNPTGPSSGSLRVHRGGSWYSRAGYCRVSSRDHDYPGFRIGLGLRLLLR